jgi:hypothetical protein
MKTQEQEKDRAKDQAAAQIDSIRQMVKALTDAMEKDDDEAREQAEQAICNDPLSVQVRTGWHDLGKKAEPDEFMILLCTGGPAVRIVGDLDDHMQPENPHIEFQDWFTPWEEYHMTDEEEDDVLSYCSNFYFES